ncbi:MAG: glutamate formiminotransferase [Actinobacteria bacterium]|nr:glutamate formiminotransferase [Actinomycetota bacterium]
MTLISIPNVSEGARDGVVDDLAAAVRSSGGRLLDVHRDAVHNRSVLTCTGGAAEIVDSMTELALRAASLIDLTHHEGVHPRIGALDVCPVVPHRQDMDAAVKVARSLATSIGDSGLPVYLYGTAAERPASRELPSIRRGGLDALIRRAAEDLPPDRGPHRIDPATGVVCVGARGPLIAYNVWLRCDEQAARSIAEEIRTTSGGPPGIRALGLAIGPGLSQISMNLVEPDITGVDTATAFIERAAAARGIELHGTEIVGLVEERFLPNPDATAARLLIEPGRTLESLLA